jgi:acyl carrier protein
MVNPVTGPDADAIAAALIRFVNASIMAQGRPMAPDDEFETAGVDSMGLIKILLFIEAEFGFWMPDDDLTDDNLASPRRLARYVRRHLETR